MLISLNPKPSLPDFQNLMAKTDLFLNRDALNRPNYYVTRGGNPLEDDVKRALDQSASGTPFQGTIVKISGHRFPDIVAAGFYGVEVKSTKEDQWKSTGSSILESTRVDNVDRIYMTFGKLGGTPIEFRSRPYEDCLYDIAVTHMPRYLIDMDLKPGQTIFDKMGMPYDNLRTMTDPIAPVAKYYRSQLKAGERLWWAGDHVDDPVSAKIRLWKNLGQNEKSFYTVYGCVNFPEIFGGDYDRYALWLTSLGVVDPHVRDQFSAGGKEPMRLSNGRTVMFPAVYRRTKVNSTLFIQRMRQEDPEEFDGRPVLQVGSAQLNQRLRAWAEAVSRKSTVEYSVSLDALLTFFSLI